MELDTAGYQELLHSYAIPWGINIVSAAAVFIIGRIIAKLILKGGQRVMQKMNLDAALTSFLGSILYAVLYIVVIIAALEQLGVNTTSVLAVFAAAGLAVGLALKDSLSNFSAGVMLIIFRPFKLGDFLEAAGVAGVVKSIQIFNTVIHTGDNREIIVPNSQIYGGTIINYSTCAERRIDLVIGIGYSDDINKAKEILAEIVNAHPLILKEPAPGIAVAALGESSVDLNVRPWVKSGDYWGVRAELLEAIKNEFDSKGISIPFPQRDIHVINTAA